MSDWKGMHQGTVAGKGFAKSRKARKTHAQRTSEIASRSSGGKK
jgi:hypothetical protein